MGPNFRRGRRRGLVVGGVVGASMAKNSASKQAASNQAPAAPTSAASPDKFAQLEQLGKLKAQGILTDEEFQAQKAIILAQ